MALSQNPGQNPTVQEVLVQNQEVILACSKLFEIYQTQDRMKQLLLVKNFAFLTGNRILTSDQYFEMLQSCVAAGDFGKLALIFHNSVLQRIQPSTAPEGPLHQQKSRIQAAFEGLKRQTATEEPIALHMIGSPLRAEQPDWVLALDESEMSMSQIFDLLKKTDSNAPVPEFRVIAQETHDDATKVQARL